MSELKLHLYDSHAERGMPDYVKSEFFAKGMQGTLCGYIRNTTKDKGNVTCKNCKRLIVKLES